MSNYSWDSVKAKAKKRVSNALTAPFKQIGADIRDAVNGAVEDFVDDVTGRYETEVTKSVSDLIRGSLSGAKSQRDRLSKMLVGNQGLSRALNQGRNFTPGLAGSAMNWLSGESTAGEDIARAMRTSSVGRRMLIETSGSSIEGLQRGGYDILERDRNLFSHDDLTVVSNRRREQFSKHMEALATGRDNDYLQNARNTARAAAAAGRVGGDSFFRGYRVNKTMMADARRQFNAVKYTQSFKGMSGTKKMEAITKAMREQGGAYRDLKRATGMGDAEALAMLAVDNGEGALGITDALADIGDLVSFGPGSMKSLSEKRAAAEEHLGEVMDREKAGNLKALLKNDLGGGAAGLYAAYVGGSDLVGYDYSKEMGWGGGNLSLEGRRDALSGAARMRGGRLVKGDLDAQTKRLMKRVSGKGFGEFKNYTKDEMDRFLSKVAVEKVEGGAPISKDVMDLANLSKGALDARVTQITLEAGLSKVLAGDTENLSKAEKDAVLTATGKSDISQVGREDVEQVQEVTEMLKTATDPKEKEALRELLVASQNEGIGKVVQRFRDTARNQKVALGALKADKGLSAEAKALVGKFQSRAEGIFDLRKGKDIAKALGGKDNIQTQLGRLASEASKLSKEEQQKIAQALGDEGVAVSYAADLRGRLSKGGMSLEQLGITREALGDERFEYLTAGLRLRIPKGIKRGDKYSREKGILKKGQGDAIDKIVEFMSGQRGTQLETAAGTESASSYANPVTIAENMRKFGSNVVTLASIVAEMKG